jgi:K+-sensing histidine kinase KdpD
MVVHLMDSFGELCKSDWLLDKECGLGMAIVKRIIDAHGGRVELGNGPGAEVCITLPCKKTGVEQPNHDKLGDFQADG